MLENAYQSLNENPQIDEAIEIARRIKNLAILTATRFNHMTDMPISSLILQSANHGNTEKSLRGIKDGTDKDCKKIKTD